MSEALIVKLGDLDHDPIATEGHEKRLTQIDDLLASLPAKGLLQSLNVRPAGKGKGYWVKAGNRRLAALRHCRDNGIEILGKKVTNGFEVAVIYSEEDDASAYETSRTENMMRLPESPVEEFRAFAKMAETKPVKEIAGIFGVTPKRVEQRLKLAQLHPDVLAALESNKITMEAAEAFTLGEPDAQAAYLKKAGTWELQPSQIKAKFTQKLVNGKSPMAKLIGAKAYKAAGGRVLGDVFSDDAYWIDTKLLDELVDKHWEKQVAEWKAEGWAFVETAAEFCGNSTWKLYQAERIKGDAPYSDADKAKYGVVYFPSAKETPIVGIKRYVEPKQRAVKDEADLDYPPAQASLVLQEARQKAVADGFAADPTLMLRVLIAALKENTGGYNGVLDISREFSIDADDDGEEPERSFDSLMTELAPLDTAALLGELGRVVAQGVKEGRNGPPTSLAALAPPTFSPEDFFGAADREYILLALKDMTDPADKRKPPKSAEDLLAFAVQAATALRWLPPQIRTSSYDGPCFISRKAEATEGEGEDPALEAAE